MTVAPLRTARRPGRLSRTHHQEDRGVHLAPAVRRATPRAASDWRPRPPASISTTRRTAITDETLKLLLQLAERIAVCASASTPCSAGDKINVSENRAVLHVALRAPRDAIDSRRRQRTSCPRCTQVLDKMADFADRLRGGDWKGHTGKRIRNVVNIGIGGSDLGPVMAYEALKHYSERELTFRFVSNVDGTDFAEAIARSRCRRRRCSSSPRRPSRRWRP